MAEPETNIRHNDSMAIHRKHVPTLPVTEGVGGSRLSPLVHQGTKLVTGAGGAALQGGAEVVRHGARLLSKGGHSSVQLGSSVVHGTAHVVGAGVHAVEARAQAVKHAVVDGLNSEGGASRNPKFRHVDSKVLTKVPKMPDEE
mmetsp:Transcript_15960/g.35525  ORF Transcript_15960/g.35525 Transcript_15960/m.35525 type:complete len:143 (+) Transcript_15960:1115-1543(+)